jgi:hypothetical protein
MKALRNHGLALAAMLSLAGACGQPAVVQQAPGTIPSSTFPNSQAAAMAAAAAPQPAALPTRAQANDSFRWAYAMETANKAAQLGAILGGPFGGPASMGLGVLGLLYGAVAAESKLAEEDARAQGQYQKETTKDQQLEAAIEKELERQRAFDNQLAGATDNEPETAASRLPPTPGAPAANGSGIVVAALTKPVPLAPAPMPFRNVEIKDLNNDGIADLWIYYSPKNSGEVLRHEESSKMDGRVDTWSYFRDGKLVRRDVDNRGNGRPDTVYYYEGQKIAREERDETGHGRMTYRADYQDGRLSKVERETHGNGRPDLWITYDTSIEGETIAKEERDLNGDGFPDLSSHYQQGHLMRRDLNLIGLEFFSKQEEAPVGAADNPQINPPGS